MDPVIELAEIEALLDSLATACNRPEENRVDVILPRANLLAAVQKMMDAGNWYLSAITGLDHSSSVDGPSEEKLWQHVADGEEMTGFSYAGLLEVLYHFCYGRAITTLRVQLGHGHPSVPSICGIIPSSTLYERELMEMFGIRVENTPVTDHLLLPDDWPDGVYPLRKDFTGFATENTGEVTDHA